MTISRAQLGKTTKKYKKRNHKGCGAVMSDRRKKTTYAQKQRQATAKNQKIFQAH